MSVIGSNILAGASGQAGYNLTNSLRFRSSASAYLNRTPASASNRKTWTWSGWVKISKDATTPQYIFAGNSAATDAGFLGFGFNSAATNFTVTGWVTNWRITTQTFRDFSAWYHIVVVLDTTQATANDRVKIYVNGVQVTSFSTTNNPTQNADLGVNTAAAHYFSTYNGTNEPFDGYLAEVNFIDGQALTPSSFGETSATTGVWIPKKYTGTYGTNGFYLPFTDNSALTTSSNVGLGKDFSGNGNYFATNNISITAGTTYDSMTDVPTLTSATAANYAVINPLIYRFSTANSTFSNGNLTITGLNTGVSHFQLASIAIPSSSSKFYWENTLGTTSSGTYLGITQYSNFQSGNWDAWYDTINGVVYKGASSFASVATAASGDIVGIAYDSTANTCAFYKNNTLLTTVTGITAAEQVPLMCTREASVINLNFGQRPFAYTPPTGFNRLNTFNLTTPTIGATASSQANKHMDATLYTGNGGSLTVTNTAGFQPDFVWTKSRSNGSTNHLLEDVIRGTKNSLLSNSTSAELARGINAFLSNGFSFNDDAGGDGNVNGQTYVGWQWKANGTGVTNTAGSITSTVSANTTAGFSIATFTAPSSNQSFTVGHGLGVAPQMTIVKRRDSATGGDWWTWHIGLGDNTTTYLALNQTAASATATNMWGTVGRNSTVCGFNAPTSIIANGTFVMYNWAAIAGYSAFGSYTGNGSTDGTFVYTGFRPRWILWKRTDASGGNGWYVLDTARSTYNVMGERLYPNLSSAGGVDTQVDYLTNGFKLRTTDTDSNASGGTYIYMAFAENPFKYANAR